MFLASRFCLQTNMFIFDSSFCGTSQVNDDFHSAGLDSASFRTARHLGTGCGLGPGDASGDQTISYVSRPCQGKSMIIFRRSSIGGGEAEDFERALLDWTVPNRLPA